MKSANLRVVRKKALTTLFILGIYMLGLGIPLPFAQLTSQYQALVKNTSIGLASAVSGAQIQRLSLFMVGLNPMMIAMLIVQMLMMTRLLGFDSLSGKQSLVIQQFLTLVLAVIQSTTITLGFHLTGSTHKSIAVIIILTTGSMFVVWLGNLNAQFGIGGTMTLIMFNLVTMSLPMLNQAVKNTLKLPHASLIFVFLIILALGVAIFWIAFGQAYYPLTTIQITMPSYEKPVTLPLGLNMGGMMMYMVGMALFSIPTMFASIYPHSFLNNPQFMTIFLTVTSLLLFYFFSFMAFSPREQARGFRNSNTYIPGLRPGKPTETYLRHLLWTLLFPGAILNTVQLLIGFLGQRYLGKYSGFTIIPMNIFMVVMIVSGIRAQLLVLFFPRKYEKITAREVQDN